MNSVGYFSEGVALGYYGSALWAVIPKRQKGQKKFCWPFFGLPLQGRMNLFAIFPWPMAMATMV